VFHLAATGLADARGRRCSDEIAWVRIQPTLTTAATCVHTRAKYYRTLPRFHVHQNC
jgi:hypothetical protein